MTTTDAYPSELQDLITTTFSRPDLADLCLRLGINFDSLPDAGLAAQARELILLLARQERLPAAGAAAIQTKRESRLRLACGLSPMEIWSGKGVSNSRPQPCLLYTSPSPRD